MVVQLKNHRLNFSEHHLIHGMDFFFDDCCPNKMSVISAWKPIQSVVLRNRTKHVHDQA